MFGITTGIKVLYFKGNVLKASTIESFTYIGNWGHLYLENGDNISELQVVVDIPIYKARWFSNVLCEDYEKKSDLKERLTQYLKRRGEELVDVCSMQKKGFKFYLGEPIRPRLDDLKFEILLIERELKALEQYKINFNNIKYRIMDKKWFKAVKNGQELALRGSYSPEEKQELYHPYTPSQFEVEKVHWHGVDVTDLVEALLGLEELDDLNLERL